MSASRRRVLVVEDDPALGPSVVAALYRQGYDAVLAADGERALAEVAAAPPDAVVLDLMLPGLDGHALLERWAGRLSVPIVVLSARSDLDARLGSFALGAVDFVPKPFFVEELVARLRLRLDDPTPRTSRLVQWGDVALDLDQRLVRRDGQVVDLTPIEVNVLACLAERPGRPVSRQTIAEVALPLDGDRLPRTVDTHISRVRKKLGPPGADALQTVFGVGYRLMVS